MKKTKYKVIAGKRCYPWDYTYLYRHMYAAMLEMEPLMIDRFNPVHVRKFRIAKEIMKRLSEDSFDFGQDEKACKLLHKIMASHSLRWWD